jgi:hypothetical protein
MFLVERFDNFRSLDLHEACKHSVSQEMPATLKLELGGLLFGRKNQRLSSIDEDR